MIFLLNLEAASIAFNLRLKKQKQNTNINKIQANSVKV